MILVYVYLRLYIYISILTGWCSWYHFFEFVSEKDLMNNILSMIDLKANNGMHGERLGFDLFQVDDGYQVRLLWCIYIFYYCYSYFLSLCFFGCYVFSNSTCLSHEFCNLVKHQCHLIHFQRAWGDWLQLHTVRFPSQSMTILVEKIVAASMTPGLWYVHTYVVCIH